MTAEVGYDFLRLGTQDPVVFQVYADYFGYDSGTRRGGFARLTFQGALGIGISLRTDTYPATASLAPYIGIGVGYYSIKASAARIPGTYGDVPGGSRRKGGIYPKILIGVQTSKRLFAEAEYQFVPDFSDIGFEKNIRGVNMRLGYRF